MTWSAAERLAYRRAWLSLLLYPLSVLAAFVLGEGMLSLLGFGAGEERPPAWAVAAAGGPALLVLIAPAAVSWLFAVRAGHEDVHRLRLPAYLASALAGALVLQNLVAFVVSR